MSENKLVTLVVTTTEGEQEYVLNISKGVLNGASYGSYLSRDYLKAVARERAINTNCIKLEILDEDKQIIYSEEL